METLEIQVPEQTVARLQEAARQLGVTLESLLQISVEEKLARLDEDFQAAASYVFEKNKELYQRLA
ncbi:MAG: DNA-binding protein [Blastocatellia bacterium]